MARNPNPPGFLLRSLIEEGTVIGMTDGQLLERFATGDDAESEAAFAALVARHSAMVFRTCRGIIRDEHEAMDAFQATFLILFRKGSSLRVDRSLGPWLNRVACRAANRARTDASRRRVIERRHPEAEAPSHDRADLMAAVHEELDRLPERFRVPIILCELEGHTCEQAALEVGCPIGTIASRLVRGRERLRRRLICRGLAPTVGAWAAVFAGESGAAPLVACRVVGTSPVVAGLAREVIKELAIFKLKAIAIASACGLGLLVSWGASGTLGQIRDGQNPAARGRLRGPAAIKVGDESPPANVRVARKAGSDDGKPTQPEAATFAGRVIEESSGKPVEGAELVVTRLPIAIASGEAPRWAGDSTFRSDADGRFAITFPPEQVVDPRLAVAISRVTHPDFVPRLGIRVPLATLLQGRRDGDRSPFEEITLERGVAYSARVVAPDGTPAADLPYRFTSSAVGHNQSRYFSDFEEGWTDADGRIRHLLPQSWSLLLVMRPARYAPYLRFRGTNEPDLDPNLWVPNDLGQLGLKHGVTLSGRLLDLQGRPVVGQVLTATGLWHHFEGTATTADDGHFTFTSLRPGNYLIDGAGQKPGYSFHGSQQQPSPRDATILRPTVVFLDAVGPSNLLELREAPTVRVPVRFVDSRNQPARGAVVVISGFLTGERGETSPYYEVMPTLTSRAQFYNEPEPRATGGRLDWAISLMPGADGVAEFRVPKGLKDAEVHVGPPDASTAFKTRLEAGGPLEFRGHDMLGDLEADRDGIEVVAYRAPMVTARIATEGGEPVPRDAKLGVGFNLRGGDYGSDGIRQADGRYRTVSLMPDHEYEFSAQAWGYVPKAVRRLNLPEGASVEVDLVLRKKPTPPAVGSPAPPFVVETLDGRIRGLHDYRGKFLLLHIWCPFFKGDEDLPRLDAIRKRSGDDRLALLGLSISADLEASRKVIAGWDVAWPQAVLRDRYDDPIIQDYDGAYAPKTYLIGPDGMILARDLVGDQVEGAVARVLGSK